MFRKLALIITVVAVFPAHAEQEWADFPSDAWKNAPIDWFIQWKRVRKYTRVAAITRQELALDPLGRQARQLYLQIWRWPDSPVKNTCYSAADRLKEAVDALAARRSEGLELLSISEIDGERCLAAIRERAR